jgi:hypothetical protein
MTTIELLQLAATIVIAIWGIYQTRVTKKLEREIHYLSIGLDQSIQLLHRAREAVIGMHKTHVFMLHYKELRNDIGDQYVEKLAEQSTYRAELRGLAFAINDQELLDLVNKGYDFIGIPNEQRNATFDEMEIRNRSQHLHTRISQLLELATKNKKNNAP